MLSLVYGKLQLKFQIHGNSYIPTIITGNPTKEDSWSDITIYIMPAAIALAALNGLHLCLFTSSLL